METAERIEKEKEIDLRNKVLDLINNPSWKEVIENAYFNKEAIRIVSAIGNFQLTTDQKKNLVGAAEGISCLQQFLSRLIGYGNQAEADIEEFDKDSSLQEVN